MYHGNLQHQPPVAPASGGSNNIPSNNRSSSSNKSNNKSATFFGGAMMPRTNTRSNRFFVFVIFVGISNHRRQFQGIPPPVDPRPIVLETLDIASLSSVNNNIGSSITIANSEHTNDRQKNDRANPGSNRHRDAIWLQDTADGSCLSPNKNVTFGDCGDATLWYLVPQTRPLPAMRRRQRFSGVWAVDEDKHLAQQQEGEGDDYNSIIMSSAGKIWLLQVVDRDFYEEEAVKLAASQPTKSNTSIATKRDGKKVARRRNKIKQQQRKTELEASECLLSSYDYEEGGSGSAALEVDRCHTRKPRKSQPSSWAWRIREDGALERIPIEKPPKAKNGRHSSPTAVKPLCLFRQHKSSGDETILTDCNRNATQFAFVRYRPVESSLLTPLPLPTLSSQTDAKMKEKGLSYLQRGALEYSRKVEKHQKQKAAIPQEPRQKPNLPSLRTTNDLAHTQSQQQPRIRMHPELKTPTGLLFTKPSHVSATAKSNRETQQQTRRTHNGNNNSNNAKHVPLAFNLLKDTNPILLMGLDSFQDKVSGSGSVAGGSSGGPFQRTAIQVHPYLQTASKDQVWTDPVTSLEYETDICEYLGHTRKKRGRHTLMGVGQYRKYVLKVYGVAFYVSKHDVLADPSFEPYSKLSAAELRDRPDFYKHLRTPPSQGANFERTLLIKTNMQLASQTMRDSLQADWQMLTEEAKATIINSSMEPIAADERMLGIISHPDNPSRCSCSQSAPPEYQANPDCCARGTELVFTWLKNGDLEIRMNGRLMDTFQRPDIAEGIFFEYFRLDDPMSTEFIERAVDGFPFLLAPLAQVKGVHMGQKHQKQHSKSSNPIIRVITGLPATVTSQALQATSVMQQRASEIIDHAGNSAKSFQEATGHVLRQIGDGALHASKPFRSVKSMQESAVNTWKHVGAGVLNVAKEVDRRRDAMARHAVASMPGALLDFLQISPEEYIIPFSLSAEDPTMTNNDDDDVAESISRTGQGGDRSRYTPQGRVFGYPLSRWLGETYYPAPDEIGPMVKSTTMDNNRKAFLALVHLYLLLLFIVSFPGTYSTTKVRNKLSSFATDSKEREGSAKRYPSDSETEEESMSDEQQNLVDEDSANITLTSEERLKYQKRLHSRSSFLRRRVDEALRTPLSDNHRADDAISSTSTPSNPLRKKSLSYFL